MIGLRDSLTLAATKLRIRRVRLVVTIIVSGLLFSLLVFGSLISRGLVHSLEAFMSQGLLNRYVASVTVFPKNINNDPTLIAQVLALEKAQNVAKVAEAKRLKLTYDPATQTSVVSTNADPGGKKFQSVDQNEPLVKQALRNLALPDSLLADLKRDASPYHLRAISVGTQLGYGSPAGYSLTPVVAGAEVAAVDSGQGSVLSRFAPSLEAVDTAFLQPFVLPGTSLTSSAGTPVPVILPIDAAEKLLGKTAPSKKATPQQQLDYLRTLRTQASGSTFTVCYRNTTALKLTATASEQAQAKAAKISGYTAPAVEYAAPSQPCQPVAITHDSRTAAQKLADASQATFDQEFGGEAPLTTPITFKIVGLLPRSFSFDQANDPLGLASSFLTSSLGDGVFIPSPAMQAQPVLAKLFADASLTQQAASQYYVEFADRASQKAFVDNHSCNGGYTNDPTQPAADPFADCRAHHQYLVNPFGNPLATLADVSQQAHRGLYIVIGVLAALAGLIMMGTIGKIIADSRKETSVFRAVGAKRRDIAQIYLYFSTMLALGGLMVAIVIGTLAAIVVDARTSPTLTVQALLAFNSSDLSRTFHLIYFSALDFAELAGFAVAVGLLGALLPLASNLRRSPIKDMREE